MRSDLHFTHDMTFVLLSKRFEEVKKFCESLMRELPSKPTPTWLLSLLALSQYNMASIHIKFGEREEALPLFEEALKYQSDLAALHPSVTRFRETLADSYEGIAELQHQARQDKQGNFIVRKAIDIFGDLVRAQPDNARFYSELARSWNVSRHAA